MEPGDTEIREETSNIVITPPQPSHAPPPLPLPSPPPKKISEKKLAHLARLNARRTADAKIKAEARRLAGIDARGRARYEKLKTLYGVEAEVETKAEAEVKIEEAPQAPEPYYRPPPRLQYAPVHTTINFV